MTHPLSTSLMDSLDYEESATSTLDENSDGNTNVGHSDGDADEGEGDDGDADDDSKDEDDDENQNDAKDSKNLGECFESFVRTFMPTQGVTSRMF